MQAAAPKRHYGMDWLRICAFALLILYHVGWNFTVWGYTTPSRGPVPYTEIPLLAMNAWRLSLLFAISGYASAALLVKQPDAFAFLKSRLARLGIPLVFAMVVVVPPQIWIGLVNGSGYEHNLLYFTLFDFFSFRNVGGVEVPTMMHMWFVLYLLAYTVGLCGALMILPASVRTFAHHAAEHLLASPWLLPLGIGFLFVLRLFGAEWTDSHMFLYDPVAHVHYCAAFLFGILLRRSEPVRKAIAAQWKPAAVLAVIATIWVAGDAIAWPGKTATPAEWHVPFLVARAVQGWATVIAMFGIADRYWNHDHRWRATLAEAVFPFYIIHQTITVFLGHAIRNWGLTALPEFVLMCAATAAGCWLFYLIGREIGPLRPLIGLQRARRRAVPMIQPATTPAA